MLRRTLLLSLIPSFLLLVGAVQAAPQLSGGHAPAPVDQARLQQRLKRRSSEVKQLQRNVREQESRSHQADRRLREQDRQLKELRRQLQAAEGSSTAGNGG